MFKHALGDTVVDRVSQYTGVITGRAEYVDFINYQVTGPHLSSDGEPVRVWISEGDIQ